ncbi:MAG TPA: glutathione S-transferase family protein [Woeseiaceae bacterium]|nr:glutathione S-transferase family protein [Woeseiaceae bacterium]
MLELFHWEPVGHSARVLICLHEIGVEYRSRYVDALQLEQFSDEFLELNPQGQLPVLRADDVAMSESGLINEFLAESFPESRLVPADAIGRYNAQVWSKFVDSHLASSLGTLGCRKYLLPVLNEYDRAALEARIASIPVIERRAGWQRAAAGDYDDALISNAERKVRLAVERMEETLAGSDWLVGGAYSIADINAFAMISGLRDACPHIVNGRDAPHTSAWADRIAERPAVQSVLTSPDLKHRPDTVFLPGPEHSRWG